MVKLGCKEYGFGGKFGIDNYSQHLLVVVMVNVHRKLGGWRGHTRTSIYYRNRMPDTHYPFSPSQVSSIFSYLFHGLFYVHGEAFSLHSCLEQEGHWGAFGPWGLCRWCADDGSRLLNGISCAESGLSSPQYACMYLESACVVARAPPDHRYSCFSLCFGYFI